MITVKYRSAIPKLEYVSVFRNFKSEIYEVNVWYKTTKRFNIGCFEVFKDALNYGRTISDKLNLDLLDATEKGDFKWVEKVKPATVQA